jgi:hypothetical protein
MLRFGAAGNFVLLSGLALVTACVNPKTDYDDFLARTADADINGISNDDASFDGSFGDAGFMNQSYVMACVSQSFQDSVTYPTFFISEASFAPSDSNGDGTFNFTDNALVVGATDTTDSAGGIPTVIKNVAVTGGKVDVDLGGTSVPASADPLMQGPIVFSDLTFHFYIGPGTNLCSLLSGSTTLPLATTLDPSQNICIYFPYSGSTGQIPTLTQAEFHCP